MKRTLTLVGTTIGLLLGGSAGGALAGPLPDGGFELPVLDGNSYMLNPAGSAWTFTEFSGVSANGSDFTVGNAPAPEGNQVGFLQWNSSFSQTVTFPDTGAYALTFLAAQRANQASSQDFQVMVDQNVVGTFTPAGTDYASYTTDNFNTTAGGHTITFQALDTLGGDNTAFIDGTELSAGSPSGTPEPSTLAMGGMGLMLTGLAAWRKRKAARAV